MTKPPAPTVEQIKALRRHWASEAAQRPPAVNDWAVFILELRTAILYQNMDDADTGSDLVAPLFAMRKLLEAYEPALYAACAPLEAALLESLSGKPHPLFKRGRGQPMSLGRRNTMGIAARALEELMQIGSDLEPAAKSVAAAIKVGKPPGHENCTWKTVVGWRERLSAGPGPKAPPIEALLRYRADVPGITHEKKADFLLSILLRGTN